LNDFLKHFKEQLPDCLNVVWSVVQQTTVNEAINEWRRYIPACVHAKGCHFEHLLQY